MRTLLVFLLLMATPGTSVAQSSGGTSGETTSTEAGGTTGGTASTVGGFFSWLGSNSKPNPHGGSSRGFIGSRGGESSGGQGSGGSGGGGDGGSSGGGSDHGGGG